MEIIIIFLIIYIIYLIIINLQLRKELQDFSQSLNYAIEGKKLNLDFDEKESSKLKVLLFKFLNSTQVRETKINEEKEKTKSLISDISHQIKTPISNLCIYLELLERSYNVEYIKILKSEVDKLEFLVHNLVKSSRMETNLIQLNKGKVSLGDIVNEVINELKDKLEEKNIGILQKKEKIILELDRRWTKEAIHNILDNAIKYCPENGKININLYKSHINYNLDISNDSEVLTENEKSKIFQRFYRGKNAKDKEGLGLGLFITREIIEKQGGVISVDSKNNKTIFSIDFPI